MMKTIFPMPNRFWLDFGDAPCKTQTLPVTQAAVDDFNGHFLSNFALEAICPQSFLLKVESTGATVYAGGDVGAAYAAHALDQLTEDGRLPRCRVVCIPHQKQRQVVCRMPKERDLALFERLLLEIADLKFNSLYFTDSANSDLSALQREMLAARCEALGMATNLASAAAQEACFELDAAAVVGYALRTRYEFSDVIGNAKVSYHGAYDVDALAGSGFLFRLAIGALAMNQPDFGNDYWDKALESSMARCYAATQALMNAPQDPATQQYALLPHAAVFQAGERLSIEIPGGCDALCVRHAALSEYPDGETLGHYTLTLDDGATSTHPLLANRNIGPIDANWSHSYDPLTHAYLTDARLQRVCCHTRPELAWTASGPATYYALQLHEPGKRIVRLELNAHSNIALRGVDALDV